MKHTPKGWEEKIAREAMMLYFLHFKEKDSMRNAWNYYWKKLQSLKKGDRQKETRRQAKEVITKYKSCLEKLGDE